MSTPPPPPTDLLPAAPSDALDASPGLPPPPTTEPPVDLPPVDLPPPPIVTEPARPIDANAQTFDPEVIEKSRELPVMVDFWAPWCAPCKNVSPLLEIIAKRFRGKLHLVKLNAQENKEWAKAANIRGLPCIRLYRHGKCIGELTGAQPEYLISQWLHNTMPPEDK